MSLIEQLGGYEKAKQKAENALANQVTRISYKTKLYINGEETKVVTGAYVRDIKKALLEYRRQHNIFEAGDKVVFTDILNSCVVTFESTETDPMQIVWLTYPDGTAGYVFHLNKIKHATDEEIKAAKRLEVNS